MATLQKIPEGGREERERAGRPLVPSDVATKSVAMPFWHEVRLDRAVFAPADNLPVLPATAQGLPLVSLGAVERQRGADVPELYRAVLAAAQHLRAKTKKVGDSSYFKKIRSVSFANATCSRKKSFHPQIRNAQAYRHES